MISKPIFKATLLSFEFLDSSIHTQKSRRRGFNERKTILPMLSMLAFFLIQSYCPPRWLEEPHLAYKDPIFGKEFYGLMPFPKPASLLRVLDVFYHGNSNRESALRDLTTL